MNLEVMKDLKAGRRGGRPKGNVSDQTQRIIIAWDTAKLDHPTLNKAALLDRVAESVFGIRFNQQVKRRELERLKRTLQRYDRLT